MGISRTPGRSKQKLITWSGTLLVFHVQTVSVKHPSGYRLISGITRGTLRPEEITLGNLVKIQIEDKIV